MNNEELELDKKEFVNRFSKNNFLYNSIEGYYVIDNYNNKIFFNNYLKEKYSENIPRKSKSPPKSPQSRKKSKSPSSPAKKCKSDGLKPYFCKSKKDYRNQLLLFHPDHNLECKDDATRKFQDLYNIFCSYYTK